MEPFGFDKIPDVLRQLFEKVERIEALLSAIQPSEDSSDELLTVAEAAEFLKVSLASLYAKVSGMEIPVSKPGRRLYFSKTELKQWIAESRRKTAKEIVDEYHKLSRSLEQMYSIESIRKAIFALSL